MSEWIVYSKDGLTERCRLKKLEYAGSYMNERTVTATFEYHSEVAFEVFDYIVYRGERFELEAIPSVKKTSKFGYTYELRFVSLKYELERCEMRDIVPNDNGVTYPSPLSFSFTGSVRYLAERIQANLDSLYGKGVWTISVASEVNNEEKNITISQQNCWNALSLVNTSYGLDFSIKGRNVTIGKKQPVVSHVFQYGKGNGLYEIERIADTNTGIVTKLRAYGSTRNLDYSYPKKPEWADSVLPVSFILSPLRLMLPSFKLDGKTDYIMANDSVVEEYGIRESSMIYEDIYPTITDVVNSNGDSIDEIMAVEEVDDSSPTFVIHLYDLGFDLESHLTTEDAQISMKSGAMQGYTFNISKIEKQADNTYKITLGRITTDSSNTGNYDIPNSQWGMSAGDKFVLLNILMPQEYIRAAEQRLLVRAQEYLAEYGKTNFSYNIGLNDRFLKEHENIYDELVEGSKLSVYDEELGIREEVTIQSITIDDYMEDNILPQVKVTLNNKPSASTLERIQGKINELSDSASNSFSTQTELLQQYRKKLDKPFFDRLFAAVDKDGKEIPSTDLSTPISYIKARFSLASLGGLTMYLDDKSFNLPTIYDGLPIDSQTIYWENGILKAKIGGGTLGSLTNIGEWADSVANVDRIMVQKKGSDTWEAMDVSGIGSASFENIFETGEGNAYTSFTLSDDKKSLYFVKGQAFITASKSEDITGIKNFINGLQINGVELKYDSTNNAVFIQKSDGGPVNFYSTGGISMYGQGNTSVKTIMDAITANLDTNTLAIENGLLTVVGGTGSIESITKQMVIDALGFTPYDASNPNGYITSATLDGFFPLSGGELIGNVYFGTESSAINRTGDASRFPSHFYRNVYEYNGDVYDHYYNPKYTASQYTYANLRVKDGSGFRTLYFGGDGQFKWGAYNVWHSGNDGTGSGLDADKLDGREGSGYTYHINGFTTVESKYIKITTLPASSDGTYGSVTISGTIGGWHSYDKADLKITVGRRNGVTFKGYSYPRNGWDILVNNNGEVLIHFNEQYHAWDLSVTCIQAVFDYKTDYTPTDTNFTKMSDSRYIVWFNNDGSVASATYAASAGNADTLDGFHAKGNGLSNLFKWGASADGNLGGVWCKLASWSATTTETNTDVGFLLHSSFSNVYAHIICRVRKGGYAYLFAAWAYGIDASNIKLCYDDSISNFELWYYGGKEYSVVTAELLYESNRNGSKVDAVTMYSNNQGTPSLSNSASLTILTLQNNVASATKLQTARKIWGQDFDGSGDVSGTITVGYSSADTPAIQFSKGEYIDGYGNIYFSENSEAWNFFDKNKTTLFRLTKDGSVLMGGRTTDDYKGVLQIKTASTRNAISLYDTSRPETSIMYTGNDGYTWIVGKGIGSTGDAFGVYRAGVKFLINSSGNVGIGTTNPTCALDVNGSISVSADANITGDLRLKGSGNYGNTLYFGDGSYCYITEPSDDAMKIYGSKGVTINGGVTYGLSVVSMASFTGNVGIGTDEPSYKLHVVGSAYISSNLLTGGGITMYSQRSLKNVVDERGLSLSELSEIKPTRYTWKDNRDNRIHFGGIADDIQQVLPEVVYKTSEGVLTMDYGNAGFAIAASLIKPVVDHEQRIKALEKENELLKQELNRLRA